MTETTKQPKMGMQKAWAALAGSIATLLITRLGLPAVGFEEHLAPLIEGAGLALVNMALVYFIPNKPKAEK
jgi:hypothetical protein